MNVKQGIWWGFLAALIGTLIGLRLPQGREYTTPILNRDAWAQQRVSPTRQPNVPVVPRKPLIPIRPSKPIVITTTTAYWKLAVDNYMWLGSTDYNAAGLVHSTKNSGRN